MLTADALPHRLERTVVIQARRETVFRFFTDSERWASWWGAGSTTDARPGGRIFIRHPGGVEAAGEAIEVQPPELIVFTYGFVSGKPIPAGSSLVTIRLEEAAGGATRLHLSHAFADAAARDEHVQGWRYQLSVFGNVVANEAHAGAGDTVDRWFAAWSEPDATTREAALLRVAAPDVRFHDRFSLVDGLEDLRPHLATVHRFMPGMRIQRDGEIRHCQGTVLADWVALTADGQERGRGTNVFVLDAGGRIASVTGFWGAARA
jgi:uncharacterized protein YndB with AHSA1/START domain